MSKAENAVEQPTRTPIVYDYDQEAAAHADDAASRLDTSGSYDSVITRAYAITAESGSSGIAFESEALDGSGSAKWSLYTMSESGEKIFGFNLLSSILFLIKHKNLVSEPGPVPDYVEEGPDKGWREIEGETFPGLYGKPIGLVLQKELTSTKKGNDTFRMNLVQTYDIKSRLTMTEIKEGKKEGVKLKRILRNLKDKNSRKAQPREAEFGGDGGMGDMEGL